MVILQESMAGAGRWYFTKEQLSSTPSRKCGLDYDKELSYRQQAANFIQDMGQRLHVSQLCINTAIVYMHRFYMFHSFAKFHRNAIAACALFLAAKVEEQPRKLEHVIKVSHVCLHRDSPPLDCKSEAFLEKAHELVTNENIMLQTLGFDIAIDHPHTYVVKCCQLVRGESSKDLAQTSYFMATNSLHLTTMCLQYKPTVVACVCIHLACKWTRWEIPRSSEGKDWFWYIDRSVTLELLEELTSEFLAIVDKCPSRLKRKIMSGSTSKPENPQGSDKRPLGDTPSTSGTSPQDLDQFGVDGRREFLEMAHEHLHQQKLALPPNLHSNSSQDSTSSLCSLPNSAPHSVPSASAATPQSSQQQSQAASFGNVPAPEPATTSLHQSPVKKSKSEAGHSITLAAYKEMKEMKERRDKEFHGTPEFKKNLSASETKHGNSDIINVKREPHVSTPHLAAPKTHHSGDDRRSHHTQPGHEKDRSRHHHKAARSQASDSSKSQGNDVGVHKEERHAKSSSINIPASLSSSDGLNSLDHGKHQLSMMLSADKHDNSSASTDAHNRSEAVPVAAELKTDRLSAAIPGDHIGHRGASPLSELKCGVSVDLSTIPSEGGDVHHSTVNAVQNSLPDLQSLQDDAANERLRPSHGATNGAIETDPKSHRHTESSKSSKSKSSKSKPSTASPKVSEKHLHSGEEKRERKRKSPLTEVLPPKAQNVLIAAHGPKTPETESIKEKSKEKATVENHVKHEKHKRSKHSQEKSEKASSSKSSDIPITPSSGGLKVIIPKDKIILSTKQDARVKPITIRGTGSPPREALKIKIPKLKITNSSSSSTNSVNPPGSLKLRIAKDRISYGLSQKSDQESSRKRERSPKDSSDHRTNKTSPSSKSPKIARTEAHSSSKKVSQSASHAEQDETTTHSGENARSSKHKHGGGGDHVGNGGGHHSSAPNKHMMDNSGMYAHTKGGPQMPPHGPYMMPYGAPPPPQQYPYQQYLPYPHPMHMRVGGYPPQGFPQVYPPMPPPPALSIPDGPPLPKEPPPLPPPPPPPE